MKQLQNKADADLAGDTWEEISPTPDTEALLTAWERASVRDPDMSFDAQGAGDDLMQLIHRLRAEIERLQSDNCVTNDSLQEALREAAYLHAKLKSAREAYRAVDDQDWKFLLAQLGDGGWGKFWKSVFAEVRSTLRP